jgi:hypothetical protein
MKVQELFEEFAIDRNEKRVVDLIQQKLDKDETVFWKNEKSIVTAIKVGEVKVAQRTFKGGREHITTSHTYPITKDTMASIILTKWANGWGATVA